MRRRYLHALPVLVAIVVAAVVTTGVAIWVLPGGGERPLAPADAIADQRRAASQTVEAPAADAAAFVASSTARPPASTATATPRLSPMAPVPTPTRPVPTTAPSPTPTPISLGDNLVDNGGFSDGLAEWYVEDDVTVVADGGRRGGPGVRIGAAGGYTDQRIDLTPGHTYRLAAWAGVSAPGESGEVGIIYLDAAGNRLTAADAPRLRFDETTPIRQTLVFVPPEGAASAVVFAWKTPGPAAFVVDDVSVRELLATPSPGSDLSSN